MRHSLLLLLLLPLGRLHAQSVSDVLPGLTADVKAFGAARTDGARDSISQLIGAGVDALLHANDVFKADLQHLPLSRVDAPDGKFRLITWNIPYSNGTHTYEGRLLVQEADRRVVYHLKEGDPQAGIPLTRKLGTSDWFGALYYTVIPCKVGKRTYYTLLGWKGHDKLETRKVIDVLSFPKEVPTFGADLFDDGRAKHTRKVFGYNAQGSMSLRYEPQNAAIVFNHLAPIQQEFASKPELLGADLSFDAYVWHKQEWHLLRDVDARNMDRERPSKRPPPAPRP